MYKVFNITVQGDSHIRKGKECQDYSLSYCDDKISIGIVCDGHGGEDYIRSAIGSKFACEIAKKDIIEFVNYIDVENINKLNDCENNIDNDDKKIFEKQFKQLESSIIAKWHDAIEEHYKNNPFGNDEIEKLSEKAKKRYLNEEHVESAYGTTMIAVAITENYWFGFQIGDGKCVTADKDGFHQNIPWDEKCFLNATTSICDKDAIERYRYYISKKNPPCVIFGSDGVDDCFKSDEQLYNFYKTILYSFKTEGFEQSIGDLEDYLPRLSKSGSGDDISIAAILDIDRLDEIEVVRDYDPEKEKAKIEEGKRIEAQKKEEERIRVEEERKKRLEEEARKKQLEKERKVESGVCPDCNHRINSNMIYCPKCGCSLRKSNDLRNLNIFWVVDDSEDVSEDYKFAINKIFKEQFIPKMKEGSNKSLDSVIQIEVLNSSNIENDINLTNVNDFSLNEFEFAGKFEFGKICEKLNNLLSNDILGNVSNNFAPYIIFMSSHLPQDDYIESLVKLRLNPWYKNSIKIAFDIENGKMFPFYEKLNIQIDNYKEYDMLSKFKIDFWLDKINYYPLSESTFIVEENTIEEPLSVNNETEENKEKSLLDGKISEENTNDVNSLEMDNNEDVNDKQEEQTIEEDNININEQEAIVKNNNDDIDAIEVNVIKDNLDNNQTLELKEDDNENSVENNDFQN